MKEINPHQLLNTDDIQVTVLITTYNQQKYIGQAIESVLSQKTDFPFQIYISEDGGSDNTRNILLQYQQKYSNIRLLLREKNVGISRNWYEGLHNCETPFVCTLEGDDWWQDDHKLQKQMDFLNAHPDYVAVSHTILQTDDAGNTYGTEPHDARILNQDATAENFLNGITFSMTACLCRNIFKDMGEKEYTYITHNRSIADYALCLLLLNAGKVFVMDEPLSCYRVAGEDRSHLNYNATTSALKKYADQIDVINASREYWQGRFDFTGNYLSNTFFPFCDRIKGGGLLPFLRAMLKLLSPQVLILFPFYFTVRCLQLLFLRLKRTIIYKKP